MFIEIKTWNWNILHFNQYVKYVAELEPQSISTFVKKNSLAFNITKTNDGWFEKGNASDECFVHVHIFIQYLLGLKVRTGLEKITYF